MSGGSIVEAWGYTKGSVFFSLHRNGAEVAQLNVFGTARVETSNGGAKALDPAKSLPFLAQCEPGDVLVLQYRVGGGGGHRLRVRNLKTTVHFGAKCLPEGGFFIIVALKGSGRLTSIPSVVQRLRPTLRTDPRFPKRVLR